MVLKFLLSLFLSKFAKSFQQRQLEHQALPCDEYKQQFQDFYLSSMSFFLTPNFSAQESTLENSKNICQQDCPNNCCSTQECMNIFNSNGNKALPNTNYFILTGGLVDNFQNIQDCMLTDKCFNLLNQHIYYGNINDYQVNILKVKNYHSQYLHSSIVIVVNDQYYLYYLGGKCQQNSNCNQLKRFRIPVKPINHESFQSEVQFIGQKLPISEILLGSSLIYDDINNRIILYGGFLVSQGKIENQQEIYQFQLNDLTWKKIQSNSKIQKTVTINSQQKLQEFESKKPQQFLYSLLTFNKDNQLLIIGGFNQNNFQFQWQQKVYIFDELKGHYNDITPDYMYYDKNLDFNLNYFPSNIQFRNDFSYQDYQHIADFNQLKKDLKRGYIYLNKNSYILIQSQNVYTRKINLEECYDQLNDFNLLMGQKLIYDCFGNGNCKNNKCQCNQGYSGSQCEKPSCLENCNQQSSDLNICLVNFPQSYCQCDLKMNYGGLDCSMKFCINDCSFNGSCNYQTGTCNCDQNYKMRDCSVFEIDM